MDIRRRVAPSVVALVLLAGLQASCAVTVTPRNKTPGLCLDRLPPKMIQHEQCANGICGYTCEPGRWPPVPLPPAPPESTTRVLVPLPDPPPLPVPPMPPVVIVKLYH